MIADILLNVPVFTSASLLHQLQHYHHTCSPSSVPRDGNMAAIPQTLQLTKAVKKQQQRSGGGNTASDTYFGMAEMDQPARYNSKLMNSIWGRYNENSVHNFKSLQCGEMNDAGSYNGHEAGQTMLQQASQPLTSAMKRRLRELEEAVSANFMDNLNQY